MIVQQGGEQFGRPLAATVQSVLAALALSAAKRRSSSFTWNVVERSNILLTMRFIARSFGAAKSFIERLVVMTQGFPDRSRPSIRLNLTMPRGVIRTKRTTIRITIDVAFPRYIRLLRRQASLLGLSFLLQSLKWVRCLSRLKEEIR